VKVGSAVVVVTVDGDVQRAHLSAACEAVDAADSGHGEMAFAIEPSRMDGIVLTKPVKVTARSGVHFVDVDGDGKDEILESCASMEGLHLMVWKGSRLLVDAYDYVGYDTEPNCRENLEEPPLPPARKLPEKKIPAAAPKSALTP